MRINTGRIITVHQKQRICYFQKIDSVNNADGSKTISFTLIRQIAAAASITHQFTIKPNDYMVDFNMKLHGADKLFTAG